MKDEQREEIIVNKLGIARMCGHFPDRWNLRYSESELQYAMNEAYDMGKNDAQDARGGLK